MRTIAFVCASLLALLALSGAAHARDIAVAGNFQEGITTDSSGVHRGALSGVLALGRVGFDAGIQLEIWDPYKTGDIGTKIQAAGVNAGVRVVPMGGDRLVGPHVTAGVGYLYLRQDYSQKRVNAMLGVADIGPGAFGLRAGAGWGFKTSESVTIAVRLEVNYWMIQEGEGMNGFPPEYADRSTNAMSFHLVLEMMRFF